MEKTYLAIDLKSFYASVECVARGLDPLTARLVVADESRTDKTICLAVSPALKKFGIPGRARLFEMREKTRELGVDFIIAKPRMEKYIKTSAKIYGIYRRFVAEEDIFVYSVDEVFVDATPYLKMYQTDGRGMAEMMIKEVLRRTGITATAGVGTNLFLAKVAMDVVAKHLEADADGVRIAELDEMSYRREIWGHRPITDIWRVGPGISARLKKYGILTMGDIARVSASENGEEFLYKLFGVNAELLIDHAWGVEPVTIRDVKKYTPKSHSMSVGQVLPSAYGFSEAETIVKEMAEELAMDLVKKGVRTNQIVMTVIFEKGTGAGDNAAAAKKVKVYGRREAYAHGTENLEIWTASVKEIREAAVRLYERIVEPERKVRRIFIVAGRVGEEEKKNGPRQMDLFNETLREDGEKTRKEIGAKKDEKLIQAVQEIKEKYGKNAVVRGTDFEEGARTRERNEQIGGHKK